MQDDFAIRSGLENRAFAFEFIAQEIGIDQVPVVGDGELAAHAIDHERLRVLDRARPSRRVTGVPDRARPFQFFQLSLAEHLRDQPHTLVDEKRSAGPVARDDPSALLPAMLECEQPVVSEHGRVLVAKYAEEPTLVLWETFGLAQLGRIDLVWRDHTK